MESELERVIGRSRFHELQSLCPGSKISRLKEISQEFPKGSDLCVIQNCLVREMEAISRFPLESADEVPNAFDVWISDINAEDHIIIGEEIGYVALAETTRGPTFPVRGLLYGDSSRVFVPLTVSWRSKTINVNFLLDTGCPSTYLRQETFDALGFPHIPSKIMVEIHGVKFHVHLSTHHFHNVDILGQNFLSVIAAVLEINYPARTAELRK